MKVLAATVLLFLCAACLDFSAVRCHTNADCISDGLCVHQRCEARAGRQVGVTIQSAPGLLLGGATRQYSAVVSGVAEEAVIWSVQEPTGGSIDQAGLYTAPAAKGTYHVVATSVADVSKSATAVVAVVVPCSDTVTTECIPVYRLGGTIAGLAGSGLVLHEPNEPDLTVGSTATRFVFDSALPGGTGYTVSVARQPVTPWQTCAVSGGTGTIGGRDVGDIAVVCTTNRYALRGSVAGLAGSGLTLRTAGEPDLAIAPHAAGFAFADSLSSGASYAIEVVSAPGNPDQDCRISNGSGTVLGTDVADVAVSCVPVAPAGLTASAGDGQVILTWNAASGAAYNLYRSTASGAGTSGTRIAAVTSGHLDDGLSNGSTYYYVITAVVAGIESTASAEVSATPVAPPPVLQDVSAASSTQINLSWTHSPRFRDDSSGYAIFRKDGAAGFYRIAGSVPASASAYADRNLAAGISYFYKVRYYTLDQADGGCCTEVNSQYSVEGGATTPTDAAAPAAPSGLVANAPGGFRVDLSWTDNASRSAGFEIERSLDDTTFLKIASVDANKMTYTDREVVASREYWYRVRTVNSLGGSAYSATAAVTTPAVTTTSIGGTIYSQDTTLTLAASPYHGASSITILNGAVVTIEPGVELRFDSGAGIEVRGKLLSIGTAAARVIFTSSSPDAATKGSWSGIHIPSNLGGGGRFRFSNISYANIGLDADGTTELYDTLFTSCYAGASTGAHKPAVRTAFLNNGVGLSTGDSILYYSVFQSNGTALHLARGLLRHSIIESSTKDGLRAVSCEIAYNLIVGNGIGLVEGPNDFHNNLVVGNDIGILVGFPDDYLPTPTSPMNNNIYGNTSYNYKASGSQSVAATNNWWGTTDAAAIKATIRDVYNDSTLGVVTYQPFRLAPVDLLP